MIWKFIKRWIWGPISVILIIVSILGLPKDLKFWLPAWFFDDYVRLIGILLGGVYLLFLAVLFYRYVFNSKNNLLFLEPANQYDLTWNPPNELQIITNPILDDNETVSTRLPIFRLKNLGNEALRDVRIQWSMPKSILDCRVKESPRIVAFNGKITDSYIQFTTLIGDNTNTWTQYFSFEEDTFFSHIISQGDNDTYTEAVIPGKLYAVLEAVFIALLPVGTLASVSKNLSVLISYREEGILRTSQYLINATATNLRPSGTGRVLIPKEAIMVTLPLIKAKVAFKCNYKDISYWCKIKNLLKS